MKKLNVKNKVLIEAPLTKVWEVLIAPKFIRQWDALPEDFQDYYLETGREIEWAGSSKMVVTEMVAQETLKLSLYQTKWDLSPSECDISFTYSLKADAEQTALSIQIGDFAQLNNGLEYYESYTESATKVLTKIKALAENKV
ncbi:SRPBCC domain-containing protein [Dyadobacter sp. CY312]|uniref:SRPBCC domain-containing protein n=1 Tax=Dyadobacter sp. CY312 TaxID=2907303 RepID=UPI001F1FF3A6|nr:SRPBCC domain-containing protein [Dyadobacter sp. CY312]MCE7042552.1 SRPBCC domain-containing protein [Dyadobacter sp. CY312]